MVTAARFTAKFTDKNRLATLHGEPDAKIVGSLIDPNKTDASKAGSTKAGAPAQPDRVSTSQMLDVAFLPEGGVRSITQTGNLAYTDGAQKAWAQRGEYTTADQMLVLNGSPRVVDTGMTTTAQTIRMNRATGDAFAEGNVKSTYSDLKPQPDGALLASSSPIHVTSRSTVSYTHLDVYKRQVQLGASALFELNRLGSADLELGAALLRLGDGKAFRRLLNFQAHFRRNVVDGFPHTPARIKIHSGDSGHHQNRAQGKPAAQP